MLAYLLIVVLSIHSLGSLWLFIDLHWQRSQMHQQMYTDQIPTQFLTILSFDQQAQRQNGLQWQHEKEFKYEGKLYDVLKVVKEGSLIHYYCVWDKQEEALHEALQLQIASQIPLSQESRIALNQVFDKTWVAAQAILFRTTPDFHQMSAKYSEPSPTWPKPFQEVSIPPPQI